LGADPGRAPAAGRVALWRLDLDHVRAEVTEHHRAVRPGEDSRAIDDADAFERAGHGRDGRGGSLGRGPQPAVRTSSPAGSGVSSWTARRAGTHGTSAPSGCGQPSRTQSTCSRFTTIVPVGSWTTSV